MNYPVFHIACTIDTHKYLRNCEFTKVRITVATNFNDYSPQTIAYCSNIIISISLCRALIFAVLNLMWDY